MREKSLNLCNYSTFLFFIFIPEMGFNNFHMNFHLENPGVLDAIAWFILRKFGNFYILSQCILNLSFKYYKMHVINGLMCLPQL